MNYYKNAIKRELLQPETLTDKLMDGILNIYKPLLQQQCYFMYKYNNK